MKNKASQFNPSNIMYIGTTSEISRSQFGSDVLTALQSLKLHHLDLDVERRACDIEIRVRVNGYGRDATGRKYSEHGFFFLKDARKIANKLRRAGITILGVDAWQSDGKHTDEVFIVCTTKDAFWDIDHEEMEANRE